MIIGAFSTISSLYCRMVGHKFRRAHVSEWPTAGADSRICKRCGLVRAVKPRKAKVPA